MEARCMKCRRNVTIKNIVHVKMKNGVKAVKGKCSKCKTNVFRIIGK
jgi:hypothetical protein